MPTLRSRKPSSSGASRRGNGMAEQDVRNARAFATTFVGGGLARTRCAKDVFSISSSRLCAMLNAVPRRSARSGEGVRAEIATKSAGTVPLQWSDSARWR